MELNISQVKQLLASGQPEKAETLLAARLQQGDCPAQVHSYYAHSLLQQGRQQEALDYLRAQLKTNARDAAQISADLAGMYLQLQQFEQAQTYFRLALEHAPKSDQLWHLLGIAQYRAGNKQQAYASFSQAEQHDGFRPALLEAEKAIENNDAKRCESILQGILTKFPAHPQASFLYASILLQNGQLEKAAEQVKRALGYSPYHQNLLNMLAQIQVQLCDFEAALDCAHHLVGSDPDNPNHRLMLADIEQNAGQMERAIDHYYQAIRQGADETQCRLQIAHLQQSLGQHEQAIGNYRACLQSQNHVGSAYWGLFNIARYQPTAEDIIRLEQLQFDPDLNSEQACLVSFSLARHKERQHQYDAAFAQYTNANLLKPGLACNPQKAEDKFAAIRTVFSADLFDTSRTTNAQSSGGPIFIVGLPRTGSTLVEQILSSHSQVEATMELKVLPAMARRAYLMSCQKQGNQQGDISCLSTSELTQLGDSYLQLSKVFRSNKPYFIDKLPPNFQHLGLIRKILPQAIIIETRRQPMAWGMAVYRQYFAQGHDFSYDLEHIAHAYHNYTELMNHWQQCFADHLFTVKYEELVTDPETKIRALLKYCGLEFEQQCLTPHQQQRYVRTASSDQVRQPIYQSAIDSWRHYQTQLAPLQQAFERHSK